MIGKLRGTVDTIGETSLILDVSGVGYLVEGSSKMLQSLEVQQEGVTLFIETHVRETEIRLFGFTQELEKEWFRCLTTVQGVGVRVALAILSALSPQELARAIHEQNKTTITRAHGVGAKVAARIVTELKGKIPHTEFTAGLRKSASTTTPKTDTSREVEDAISALVNLGYQSTQARAAIHSALKTAGEAASTQMLIRMGLQELVRN